MFLRYRVVAFCEFLCVFTCCNWPQSSMLRTSHILSMLIVCVYIYVCVCMCVQFTIHTCFQMSEFHVY